MELSSPIMTCSQNATDSRALPSVAAPFLQRIIAVTVCSFDIYFFTTVHEHVQAQPDSYGGKIYFLRL